MPDPSDILTLRTFLKAFTCNLTLKSFFREDQSKKPPCTIVHFGPWWTIILCHIIDVRHPAKFVAFQKRTTRSTLLKMVRSRILPGVEKVCFYCRLKMPDKTSLALHYVRWKEPKVWIFYLDSIIFTFFSLKEALGRIEAATRADLLAKTWCWCQQRQDLCFKTNNW